MSEKIYNIILEKQGVDEEVNPAFDRKNGKSERMKKAWRDIDAAREELQEETFGKLSEKLYELTKAKANVMGEELIGVPKLLCTAGNAKLPGSVLIVNMSSALMCPSYYLGQCLIRKGSCYAQSDENRHTNGVLPNRQGLDILHTQMLQQYQHGNKKPMQTYFGLIKLYIQLANVYCDELFENEVKKLTTRLRRDLTPEEENIIKKQQYEYQITDVRLNETGDFQCQLAVDLWDEFAEELKNMGVSTHAYSARNLDFTKLKNIAVNASRPDMKIPQEQYRTFLAVTDATYNKIEGGDTVDSQGQPVLGQMNFKGHDIYYYKCPCGKGEPTCDRCGVCFRKNLTGHPYTIFVRLHGKKNLPGLKNLFTLKEINDIIKKEYQEGWITEKEYQDYLNPINQRVLSDISAQVMDKRMRDADGGNRKTTKKEKKIDGR